MKRNKDLDSRIKRQFTKLHLAPIINFVCHLLFVDCTLQHSYILFAVESRLLLNHNYRLLNNYDLLLQIKLGGCCRSRYTRKMHVLLTNKSKINVFLLLLSRFI